MSESKNPEVKIKKTYLKIIKEENIPDVKLATQTENTESIRRKERG